MKEEDDSSNITCDAFWDSSIPHAFLNAANLFISYKSVSRVTAEREAGAKTRVGSVNSTVLQEGRVHDWTIWSVHEWRRDISTSKRLETKVQRCSLVHSPKVA